MSSCQPAIADADAGFHERVQGYCRRILAECDGVAAYAFRANGPRAPTG